MGPEVQSDLNSTRLHVTEKKPDHWCVEQIIKVFYIKRLFVQATQQHLKSCFIK